MEPDRPQHDRPASCLIAQHHSSTIFVSSTFHFRNEFTGFPKIYEQPQIYRYQNGDMNKTPYGGQITLRRQRTKLSRPGAKDLYNPALKEKKGTYLKMLLFKFLPF